LPEALANLQRLAGAAPDFPPSLAGAGASYLVQARVCVHPNGQVDSITLLRSAHPILDANVRTAVGKWRYRPLLVAGAPVPFCTLLRFEFRAI
jgi:TonB family protein